MADFQQVPVPSSPEPRQPQAAEGGLMLQAAIAQSAELQPGYRAGAPPPLIAGMSPEELAAQTDPCTGLSIGAVRLIDAFVDDVGVALQPWIAARDSDDPRFDASVLTYRIARFLQVFAQVTGAPVAGPAEAELSLRLAPHRALVDQIRSLADPGREAGALLPLARWLGLDGLPAPHHYTFELLVGLETSWGVAGAGGGLLQVTYRHPVLPGWTRLVRSAELGVALSAMGGSAAITTGSTAETSTLYYLSPSAFDRAHYTYARVQGGVGPGRGELGALRLQVDGHALTLDTSGLTDGIGARGLSAGAGVGELVGVGGAAPLPPIRPPARSVAPERAPVPGGFRELVFFGPGSAEIDAASHAALEALVQRTAQVVERAPGAEPQVRVEGRASADWAAARASDEARHQNEGLAADRAMAVQDALDTRLASAGLPRHISRQIVAAARVGEVPGDAFDRQVEVAVSFDLCAPRRAADHAKGESA